jgi:hypothetical protein
MTATRRRVYGYSKRSQRRGVALQPIERFELFERLESVSSGWSEAIARNEAYEFFSSG